MEEVKCGEDLLGDHFDEGHGKTLRLVEANNREQVAAENLENHANVYRLFLFLPMKGSRMGVRSLKLKGALFPMKRKRLLRLGLPRTNAMRTVMFERVDEMYDAMGIVLVVGGDLLEE